MSLEAHGLIQILSPLKGRRVITCGLGERVRERLFEHLPAIGGEDDNTPQIIDELIALAASADWKAIGGRSQANDRKVFACLLEALKERGGKTPIIELTYSRFAKRAGMRSDSVRKALKRLEEYGLIEAQSEKKKGLRKMRYLVTGADILRQHALRDDD